MYDPPHRVDRCDMIHRDMLENSILYQKWRVHLDCSLHVGEGYNIRVALNILFPAMMDETSSCWTPFLVLALNNIYLFPYS